MSVIDDVKAALEKYDMALKQYEAESPAKEMRIGEPDPYRVAWVGLHRANEAIERKSVPWLRALVAEVERLHEESEGERIARETIAENSELRHRLLRSCGYTDDDIESVQRVSSWLAKGKKNENP